ncbi:TIGR03087 family PEP-CTERM/XrtA system glycosyltransferase [Temperatibacter marinus]|uniref:TIGR03087 family PEP-CTERM/XrtA system glycosyltransferase n=1 Tax=Temperatibacter marinus TaxID=1456591 RepID=A0AA52H8Y4_9PROT|nr:TIGR03087 family PEP-CTERM/XrtA system glycosyltransferase [Temperatibacter marinus]WND02601.1 TIGR03087 family PEP-CTERM/XrtA system glycosyltransferase [Temperatibacter marinus]
MANILFLAHRIPYPPNKGDKIRSWNFLKHLLNNHSVHLGCFIDDPEDRQHISYLKSLCESVHAIERTGLMNKIYGLSGLFRGQSITRASYTSRSMQRYTDALIQSKQVDGVFVFSCGMAQFSEKHAGNIPILMDMVDVDSAKWEAYSADSSFPMSWIYNREAITLGKEEDFAARSSHETILVSAEEAALFKERMSPQSADLAQKVSGLNNGVDCHYFSAEQADVSAAEASDLVFTGAMDYRPNIEAVCWFCENVFPMLKNKYPTITFAIVGGKPSQDVQRLAEIEGVIVTDRVPETRDWIKASKIMVAPLRTARGVQNKVLEGMAMAKPVVSTTEAYTGIEAPQETTIFVRDDPILMAKQILSLLEDVPHANSIGAQAREWVMANFSWESQFQTLDSLLTSMIETDSED